VKTICFDLRALQIGHQNRGIGMYARSVLEHLPMSDDQYVFYCFDKNNPIEELGIKTAVNYRIAYTPTVKTALGSPKDIFNVYRLVNHRFKPLRREQPDVFVQFDFTLGIPRWRNTRTIVIGYDLIPLIMKQEYLPGLLFAWHHSRRKARGVLRALYYRMKYRLHYSVYKRADTILCISDATARTFHQLLNIPSSKLVSLPLAPVLSAAEPDQAIAKHIHKPYLLYVGGTDSRKHICDIVYAYNIARGRGNDLALVLAGNEFESIDQMTDPIGKTSILTSPYRSDIKLVGFVTDAEKLGLYQNAYAFVFTSMYEGFGLPVVEAMSAGCPVIAYNNSSIPEAAGDAALLVETGGYVGVARSVVSLRSPELRQRLTRAGMQQAQNFSWSDYITSLMQLINRA